MPDFINCPLRHENGNCLPCGGFCTSVSKPICEAVQRAYRIGQSNLAKILKLRKGHWTGMDGDTCSECGRSPSEIMDADSYYAIGFNVNQLVSCPFCGAVMKERETDG